MTTHRDRKVIFIPPSWSLGVLFMYVYARMCTYGVRCAAVTFLPVVTLQPTPHGGQTHRCPLVYACIGVITVVSTKCNNFAQIPCVFPAGMKRRGLRRSPLAAATALGYQTSPRDDGVEPSRRPKLTHCTRIRLPHFVYRVISPDAFDSRRRRIYTLYYIYI
jgi:hypothetical protein